MNDEYAIICVDDEEMVLIALRQQIEDAMGEECIVEMATSAEEALEVIAELVAEDGCNLIMIVSDWLMPGMKGDQFLIEAHKLYPTIEKVLLSGQANDDAIENAKENANLKAFIHKPWDSEELIDLIKATVIKKSQKNKR